MLIPVYSDPSLIVFTGGLFPRGSSGRNVRLTAPPTKADVYVSWSLVLTPPIRLHGTHLHLSYVLTRNV
jgi:hypothetical protein